jgi:sugar phosphate isomerase/epimerase
MTLEALKRAIDLTVELGAPMVVCTCTDPNHDRWVDLAASYCEAANEANLKIALEFAPFSEAKSLDVGCNLMERVGASNLGLLVDSLHLARSGGKPSDLRKVDPGKIFVVQLCDVLAKSPSTDQLLYEAINSRLYPGDGELPLYDFLDALPAGVEIECEVPIQRFAALSPLEQAKRANDAVRSYLHAYCTSRQREDWA